MLARAAVTRQLAYPYALSEKRQQLILRQTPLHIFFLLVHGDAGKNSSVSNSGLPLNRRGNVAPTVRHHGLSQ